ncbi:hypothetical protein FRC14_001381 [Serendipita sp. 396]|nr:hypothetical protein FRC14_001381 [Serendipita sp. 396]
MQLIQLRWIAWMVKLSGSEIGDAPSVNIIVSGIRRSDSVFELNTRQSNTHSQAMHHAAARHIGSNGSAPLGKVPLPSQTVQKYRKGWNGDST